MSGTTLKKKTSLRLEWSPEMENMLLDLWEENIEGLRGTRKNSHIYQEMAAAMVQVGFAVSWTDVRTKIDNFTRKYKQEKAKIGTTGGTPSAWCYYNKIHSIVGAFKVHNIELSMHERTNMSTLLDDIIVIDPIASSSSLYCEEKSPPQKKRKADTTSELVRLTEERIQMQRQHHEEKKQQVSEMLKRLDNISSQNAGRLSPS